MFQPGNVHKQAEKKKKSIISRNQNLADHYTPMLKDAPLVLVALDYPTSQNIAHLD